MLERNSSCLFVADITPWLTLRVSRPHVGFSPAILTGLSALARLAIVATSLTVATFFVPGNIYAVDRTIERRARYLMFWACGGTIALKAERGDITADGVAGSGNISETDGLHVAVD
ncbi:hypothetical protein BKA93DRAFT_748971 [Sparassis latifolia]